MSALFCRPELTAEDHRDLGLVDLLGLAASIGPSIVFLLSFVKAGVGANPKPFSLPFLSFKKSEAWHLPRCWSGVLSLNLFRLSPQGLGPRAP